MNEICNHGRVVGHTCLDCPDGVAVQDFDLSNNNEQEEKMNVERQPTGLDAPYYDLPENIHSAQDLIEYLDLNFANGNILKSLIREHGAQTKATDTQYEAEKRYYFAKRHLSKVQREKEIRRRLPNVPEGEETP